MFDRLPKYSAAYAVAIGGILLTCLSSWNVRQELQTSHLREIEWAAADRIQSVRAVVAQGLDALHELTALFHSARAVDENKFQVFADSLLERRPYIDSLLWAPLLISPRQGAPRTVPAGSGPDGVKGTGELRVPVLLSASRAGSGVEPGVDLNASDELAALFKRARESGSVAVSGRMELAQAGKEAIHVVYAVLPLYAKGESQRAVAAGVPGKRPDPLGFVIGIYNIERMIHVAISLLEPRGVEVLVRDESGVGDAKFLYFYASRLDPGAAATAAGQPPEGDADQPRMTATVPFGDREWSVTCVATHAFRSAEAFTRAHWLVLLGGILFTALLTFYLVRSRRELDDRIRLTQTIFEREELFRQLAETVDVVFWAINADGTRLEYIGPAFRQIAGGEARLDDPSPALMLDIFEADDRRTLDEAIRQLQTEGGRFTIVLPVSRGDRGLRWLRVCGFPVREPGCELSRIVGFFEDITEHKLAEDALRDSEARLRTLFNHSPDLIFTVDGEASILLTNRPLLYPVGGAGEKRSELILPPDVRDGYLQKLRQVFTSGRVEHFQYASSDNTWWEIRMVPISSATAVIAAMVVITDITENRKLQWQAVRNARLASLGVLSAGIAHEINNPNHAILTNASLLTRIWQDALPILNDYEKEQGAFMLAGLRFAQARETIEQGMSDIGQNAKRIQKIIDNLKHLGRQDRGHMDELADIGKVLSGAVALLEPRIRKHTDVFVLDLPEAPPTVKGNVQQLEQVFINVIVNALESLPDRNRSVRVSARPDSAGTRVIVEVADQGTGIPEDVMPHIGEPFYTTKAESGGTGLGMSISSSIVDKHGGVLRFATNDDHGTTVSIDLPAATEE